MSQYVCTPTRTFISGDALALHLRVKTTAGKLALAGANDVELGTMENRAFAENENVSVRLRTAQGTAKMIASGAITAFAPVFAAASGKVAASGSILIGFAMHAVSANNDVVEVLRVANGPFIPAAAQQALSGAGAINVTSFYTAVTTTGADALTLVDGTVAGQLKKIQLIVDGGDGTLTPDNLNGGTTITFADAGDFALLQWDGASWVAIELGNAADGATAPVLA